MLRSDETCTTSALSLLMIRSTNISCKVGSPNQKIKAISPHKLRISHNACTSQLLTHTCQPLNRSGPLHWFRYIFGVSLQALCNWLEKVSLLLHCFGKCPILFAVRECNNNLNRKGTDRL